MTRRIGRSLTTAVLPLLLAATPALAQSRMDRDPAPVPPGTPAGTPPGSDASGIRERGMDEDRDGDGVGDRIQRERLERERMDQDQRERDERDRQERERMSMERERRELPLDPDAGDPLRRPDTTPGMRP